MLNLGIKGIRLWPTLLAFISPNVANVHILIVRGFLTVNLSGADILVKEGDLLPGAFKILMIIKNIGSDIFTFLVFKFPNLSEIQVGRSGKSGTVVCQNHRYLLLLHIYLIED